MKEIKYYNVGELENLSPQELIQYKKQLQKGREYLLEQAEVWTYYHQKLIKEMERRLHKLETEEIVAEVKRQTCDYSQYSIVCEIH